MSKTCIFCGGSPLTREHVWPDWMNDELLPETRFTLASEGKPTRSWVGAGASPTVRAVCRECNNGWMSLLEAAAKPILVPLIRGEFHTVLEPSQQQVLAAWAAKTAIILAQLNPGAISIQPEHFASLRAEGEPAASVRVFIAGSDARHEANTFYRDTVITLDRPAFDLEESFQPEAYVSTIGVRHVVFQVAGSALTSLELGHSPPFDGSVQRIWPTSGAFSWPPGNEVLDPGALEAFADHWKHPK